MTRLARIRLTSPFFDETSMRRFPCCVLMLLLVAPSIAQEPDEARFAGLLPKAETGAAKLLARHPTYDGRGLIVAILDTGVDPGAPGLQTTSDGQVKIIDVLDATGAGDVSFGDRVNASETGTLDGVTGRTLKVDPNWKNPSGKYRLGWKAAFDFFPRSLVTRISRDRRQQLEKQSRRHQADLLIKIRDLQAKPSGDKVKQQLAEYRARLEQLDTTLKDAKDPGPIFDCVLFHDGQRWLGVVDTDEDGELADETPMASYRHQQQFATVPLDEALLNFCLDIAPDGASGSIVVDAGAHATHVAGIVGAYFPDQPNMNGIAPGVQIVSIKIGDTRLGSMETGLALEKAAQWIAERGCHLVNMSYGEPTRMPNAGRLTEIFTRLVQQHNVVFVASAGNSGPALSTAGAPGGTSSALLGVGAYLSPEMMQAEYSLRERLPELTYTWTSRGPTFDGDLGVDLLAPGGAVAPVPVWTLRRSMQMNGTSMASPNACGNIALLLSALQQNDRNWTAPGIRRVLKNSARAIPNLDPFTQGAGLIQIDQAVEDVLAEQPSHRPAGGAKRKNQTSPPQASAVDNPWWFDVRLSLPDRPRGIVLREAFETEQPLETTVRVTPVRLNEGPADRRLLEIEYHLALESTADWVQVGPTLLLVGGTQSFAIRVEPNQLEPGVHFAEIQAYEVGKKNAGPLFTVPVSVLKPHVLADGQTETTTELSLEPGEIHRSLLAVPQGATWADVSLQSLSADSSRSYLLHTVQAAAGQSFEDHEFKQYLTLTPGETQRRSLAVTPGMAVEVCLAQNWSSLGSSRVQLKVNFHGLTPSNERLVLTDSLTTPVRVAALLEPTTLKPKAELSKWRHRLFPRQSELKPLVRSATKRHSAEPLFQLELHYQFDQADAGKVTLQFPWNQGVLYDSELSGVLWHLYDGDAYRTASGDASPQSVQLRAGPKQVRLYLQHDNPTLLERFRKAPLDLERSLKKAPSVGFYTSEDAARARRSEFTSRQLSRGEQAVLYAGIQQPWKAPSELAPGDWLLGSVTWSDRSAETGSARRPGGFPFEMCVPALAPADQDPTDKDAAEPEDKGFAASLWKAELAELKRLSGPKQPELFEKHAARLLKQKPDNLEVLLQRLHHLDNVPAFRKQHLTEVVEAADAVIALIDENKIQQNAARVGLPGDAKAQRLHQQAVKLRETLVDTLYRRGRAIGYRELPEVLKKQPIADPQAHHQAFEANFAELRRWVDTTEKKYFLLHVRRERRLGHFGQALATLNKQMQDAPLNFWYHKKRRDLYTDLGWSTLASWEQRWLMRMFPSRAEEAKPK